jgi:hypothetical protein
MKLEKPEKPGWPVLTEKVKIGNACNKSVFLLRMLMTVGVCTINKRNLYSLSYLPAGTAVCTDAECCHL